MKSEASLTTTTTSDTNAITGYALCASCFVQGNYAGHHLRQLENVMTAEKCQWHCQQDPLCYFFTYRRRIATVAGVEGDRCTLKEKGQGGVVDPNDMEDYWISGPKICR